MGRDREIMGRDRERIVRENRENRYGKLRK